MNRIATVTVWLMVSYFVLLAFGVIVNMFLNTLSLRTFERNFAVIEHPALTTSLAMFSKIGQLGGNSNHCDYFIGNL
ncbi:MAG: hypothetical protein AAB853_03245, partial [Patescibacteria group bacterium]